jgi:hypothetical protein
MATSGDGGEWPGRRATRAILSRRGTGRARGRAQRNAAGLEEEQDLIHPVSG